jgi:hypothetical protein
MKTAKTKLMFIPFWVILSAFFVAACSTEEMDDLEAELNLSNERELNEGIELKKASATQNQILAEIRRATAKYHNLDAADADGYELDPRCVEHTDFGGMGHHAANMSRIIGVDKVIPSEPGVLVYEPMKNGKYKLVAAEFLILAEPWDAMNPGPPMLGEVEFDDHREMTVDEFGNPVNAKGGPPFPHYQLHVWVWKNNPNGMYAPYNPNVSCQ